MFLEFFYFFIRILIIIIFILISVAYFTLAERKILAIIQRRKGPNVVGIYGLLQPLADGLKLLIKEVILPSQSNFFLFIISPLITFTLALLSWSIIPFSKYGTYIELNLGLLFILTISSAGVYGIILAGWSSNSKYSFLGALRSTSQMICYEMALGFSLLSIVICCETFNLNEMIYFQSNLWFIIPFFPLGIMFFIIGLAETNRHPFDLPEAEAELVSGYNTEYSGMSFALFSLAEYSNMLLMSALNTIIFFGGWLSPINIFFINYFWFGLKISVFVILYIVARAILPRYRYDQLMDLGWKIFLPLSIGYLVISFSFIYGFDLYNT
jgi:NADH-quinone oxidoreductase subunit H